jgi:hypothetical protein
MPIENKPKISEARKGLKLKQMPMVKETINPQAQVIQVIIR